jgi:DNA excision repair protein ERCC-2
MFLSGWLGPDKGFSRILSLNEYKDKKNIMLSYRCLDPSLASTVVAEHALSTILMSGTLTPTSMYHDLLGFPEKRTEQKELGSPFPKHNKLTLVVPETTTKFSQRDEKQFQEIAKICSNITNLIKGNSAIFLPSYFLLDQVNRYFSELSEKRIIREVPRLSKEGKHDLLEEFKSQSKEGAVLLGVASGSFGEGVDLPGDLLKCVIVVGIPLQKPDLETNELIQYYDNKFGHGWDYAYLYPAILTSLQNAGRCIRSETDKGVIVFLDQRYAWPRYKNCFSKDHDRILTPMKSMGLIDYDLYKKTYKLSDKFYNEMMQIAVMWKEELHKPVRTLKIKK